MNRSRWAGSVACVGIAVGAAAQQATFDVIGLGEPLGISADGKVVVGTSGGRPFRWTADEGMVFLTDEPGYCFEDSAVAASADGSVVVGYYISDEDPGSCPPHAFRWTAEGGLETLESPGWDFYFAWDVSADGSVVVGLGELNGEVRAFVWYEGIGALEVPGIPGGNGKAVAYGVSADGAAVVGLSSSPEGAQAFRWTAEAGSVGLGDLPGGGFESTAVAVSDDGLAVAGTGNGALGPEAFLWTAEGGMIPLGELPGGKYRSVATDISGDGSVVVGWSDAFEPGFARGPTAFVWTAASGIQSVKDVLLGLGVVEVAGWHLLHTTGVSATGEVLVGFGLPPEGPTHIWIAMIPSLLCAPDLNGDGALNIFDFLEFVNLFNANDPGADCDASGDLTLQDFLCFLEQFSIGCGG